jgi:hypothetical protein
MLHRAKFQAASDPLEIRIDGKRTRQPTPEELDEAIEDAEQNYVDDSGDDSEDFEELSAPSKRKRPGRVGDEGDRHQDRDEAGELDLDDDEDDEEDEDDEDDDERERKDRPRSRKKAGLVALTRLAARYCRVHGCSRLVAYGAILRTRRGERLYRWAGALPRDATQS